MTSILWTYSTHDVVVCVVVILRDVQRIAAAHEAGGKRVESREWRSLQGAKSREENEHDLIAAKSRGFFTKAYELRVGEQY